MGLVQTIDQNQFESEVVNSPLPVLVDFYADWCPPCRMLAPTLDQLSQDVAGTAKIVKVNVDHSPALASHFGVQSIPTLILIKDGEVVHRQTGAAPLAALKAIIAKAQTASV